MSSQRDRLFQLAKRYRELAKARRDLDFKLCQWARDLRREFPNEEDFVRWCVDELGLTDGEVRFDLIPRSAAFDVAPDPATWSEIGGYKAARKLARLPRKEQVACIAAMKSTGYGVDKIMRDRGHTATPALTPAPAPAPSDDAAKLARFIAETLHHIPNDIKRIVERYVAKVDS